MASYGINTIFWPAYSPDINPIEHVWRALKSIIYGTHKNVHKLKNNRLNIKLLSKYMLYYLYR